VEGSITGNYPAYITFAEVFRVLTGLGCRGIGDESGHGTTGAGSHADNPGNETTADEKGDILEYGPYPLKVSAP